MKVTLKGYIIVPEPDLSIIQHELSNHKVLTTAENGCIVFQVNQDPYNKYKFNVYEEFVDQAAFDNHQARVKAPHWGLVTKNVERHYEIMRGDDSETSL